MRNKIFLIAAALLIVFASCNKTPQHARYIPKNAMVVVGLNTKGLSKKLAWNAIIGSKLLDEMKAKMSADKTGAAEDLANAGIDVLSTTYFYFNPSVSENEYKYVTAVVPLSNAKQWESYLQKNFKGISFKQKDKHTEALVTDEIYAAWNSEVAIVRKTFVTPAYKSEVDETYEHGDTIVDVTKIDVQEQKPDPSRMEADMQTAFTIQKDNEITADKRFTKLQMEGDDISFWMNYDVFMNRFGSMASGMPSGLALGNNLWKEAAVAAGLNFDKGKISADTKYYVSEELNELYSKFGSKDPDKDMMNRLPTQNLAMLFSANISPDGIKATMEKMGVTGLMNLALGESGMNVDDLFKAFTGDMAMSITDFKTFETTTAIPNINEGSEETSHSYRHSDVSMNYVFVLKTNDGKQIDKMVNYVKNQNGLQELDANTYQFTGKDSLFVMRDAKYLLFTNNLNTGKNYLSGTYTNASKPAQVKEMYGHPTAFFMDIQTMLNGINTATTSKEQALLQEAKNMFGDITMKGGDHKKEYFSYSGNMNLVNKDENSLLQLLNFTYKMQQINEQEKAPSTSDASDANNGDTTVRN